MAQDATVTWLTQEAYDRLAAELEQLSTRGREEIAKRIEAAREEGDLKENGGYHAAKDEQGKIEARIRQLKELLRTAEVGDAPQPPASSRPAPSSPRSIAGDEETFLIGSREIAGDSELDVWSDAEPARRRDPRPEGRRQDELHRAQRPRDRRRGHRRRDLGRPVADRRARSDRRRARCPARTGHPSSTTAGS